MEGQHQKGAFDALLLHRIFHVLHSRFELVHIFVVLGNHIVDQVFESPPKHLCFLPPGAVLGRLHAELLGLQTWSAAL